MILGLFGKSDKKIQEAIEAKDYEALPSDVND